LGIDYENLIHQSKPVFVRELLLYLNRKELLGDLFKQIAKKNTSTQSDAMLLRIASVLLPASPRTKLHLTIRLVSYKIDDKDALKQSLVSLLSTSGEQITTDEIEIVLAAQGSLRLLISIPAKAAERWIQLPQPIRFKETSLITQILPFEHLPIEQKRIWKQIAQTPSWPPVQKWPQSIRKQNLIQITRTNSSNLDARMSVYLVWLLICCLGLLILCLFTFLLSS
jgi:hypothetical protein